MRLKFLFCLTALCMSVATVSTTVGAADLAEIKARGELRHLGIRYANFVTGAGDGLDAEIVQGFAKHIGVRYRLVYSDFYTVVGDLLGRKVRVEGGKALLGEAVPQRGDMIATGFTRLAWRETLLNFSDPVFPSQVLLVTRSEAPERPITPTGSIAGDIQATRQLIGKKSLLVMEGTCLDPASYGLRGIGLDLRSYTKSTNLNEMVPAMLNRDAYFTLLDVPDLIIDLRRWSGRIKVLGPISEHQVLAAAFLKEAPALRDAYNEYLRGIKADGSYDRLVDKYYPGIRSYFPEFFAKIRPAK